MLDIENVEKRPESLVAVQITTKICLYLWSCERRRTGVIPGNHAFQHSRNRAIEYQQAALAPMGEATSGLSCKGWANITCSDAARPVSGVCIPGMPTTAGTFY